MFEVPHKLAQFVLERSKDFALEGYVQGKGPKKPILLLVGEAPGEHEIEEGVPFIGRAGSELMHSLQSIGLTREDVYMTSTVRSRPFKWGEKKERDGTVIKRKYNRAPTMKEQFAHAPVLDYELAHLQPMLIVTLGNAGLKRLLGKEATVTRMHGQYIKQPIQCLQDFSKNEWGWTEKTYGIIPTFHPASVFYRPSNRPFVEADWITIGHWLEKYKK